MGGRYRGEWWLQKASTIVTEKKKGIKIGYFIWTIWKIWIVQGIYISIVSGGSEGRVSFLLSGYQKEANFPETSQDGEM